MKWSENDKLFFEEAKKGQQWQEYLGHKLNEEGLEIKVHDLQLRDSIEQASEYRNQEDIWVWTPSGTRYVLECKSRDLNFSSPKTFPFDAPMVDTQSSWEIKEEKPDFYVCVSQRTGAIIALHTLSSEKYWFTKNTFDRVRQIWDTWLCCHKNQWISFSDFVWLLKDL